MSVVKYKIKDVATDFGVAPKQIMEIRALVRKLGERKTVIISSHILAEIEEICDHVLILSGGRLIANAPMEELRGGLGGVRIKMAVRGDEDGVIEVINGIEDIESCTLTPSREAGVVQLLLSASEEATDLRDRIFFAMADRRYAVLSMEREENTLEGIFLSLTEQAEKQADGKTAKGKAPAAMPELDGEYELIDDEEEEA